MPDEEEQQPDMRANLLKSRKHTAANRADTASLHLKPGGSSPVSNALSAMETAWVSPSRERTTFAENLEGAGTAILGAFTSQAESCRGEAGVEPAEVDYDDPYEGWKASTSRIDARVSASQHYPRGY